MRVPFLNYGLLGLCVAAFVFQLSLGDQIDDFLRENAFIPQDLKIAIDGQNPQQLVAVMKAMLTSMFLHGGWFHIIGNLLYLRVFGDNVEDRFGHAAFLVFYLMSGVVGSLAQYAYAPDSTLPVVGASGAIAGVLGAYVVLFPRARIVTLFPIIFILTFIEVPAIILLGIWGLQQLLNGYLALGSGLPSDVAWFAHIGGFSLGLAAGIVYRIMRRPARRRNKKTG